MHLYLKRLGDIGNFLTTLLLTRLCDQLVLCAERLHSQIEILRVSKKVLLLIFMASSLKCGKDSVFVCTGDWAGG